MRDISLWLITNKSDIAKFAIANGVDRIFVDLELIGKSPLPLKIVSRQKRNGGAFPAALS